MYRTHNCGILKKNDIGKIVTLSGWINNIRNLGSVIFIDLRDMYGITQLKFNKKNYSVIEELLKESVITITGQVIERISKNFENPTGEIEINISNIKILNKSIPLPFNINEKNDSNEELRMKYRYLDIRRNEIKKRLIHRHNISLIVRNYLANNGFIEIETPILIKSTPEGARDFIVPSRIHPGKFYTLPQSPQSFKQLLIIGGIDKYFQIAKCFRDEDLRSDRQFEFTQIDCEMAFIDESNIMNFFEDFLCYLFNYIKGIKLKQPWPRITYNKAIKIYGSDKPDIRFKIKISELTEILKSIKNIFFLKLEIMIGISIPKCEKYSLSQINNIIKWYKNIEYGKNFIIWIQFIYENNFRSSANNLLEKKDFIKIIKKLNSKKGDLIIILCGKDNDNIRIELGKIRLKMADELGLRKSKNFEPLWITDFPLLKWNKINKKYDANHHPFTAPNENDIELLEYFPKKVKAKAYDIIINGKEIGGGSIRINKKKLQKKIFKIIGLSKKDIESKFGFLINALEYGAPPHGGIAIGLDRLVAILFDDDDIRNYIAFPKNNSGRDTMINSPSEIDNDYLKSINIKIIK